MAKKGGQKVLICASINALASTGLVSVTALVSITGIYLLALIIQDRMGEWNEARLAPEEHIFEALGILYKLYTP